MNETIKLNLGSGTVTVDGYRNLDHKLGSEIYPLSQYADGSVDEVRASHCLEHFSHTEVENVVKEWVRVLKPGGKLKIAVPDFDWIVKAYQNGHRDDYRLEHYLFGGQKDGDDFHKAFFNEGKLQKLLEGAGLTDVQEWESDADDCSSYHVSLNLEGRKPEWKLHHIGTPTCEFLKDAKGVIHVGANSGQFRDIYAGMNLPVIWVEAIPEVFEQLQKNIADYPKQMAFNWLLTDRDGVEYDFKVSNNDGQSSSIFEFQEHTEIWPTIEYTRSINLISRTLKTLIESGCIDQTIYDALVLDVQGSELLVLKGAARYLDKFKFVRAEACNFPLYAGGCEVKDLDEFFASKGWERTVTWMYAGATNPKVRQIYEALYQKKIAPVSQPKRPPLQPIFIEDEKSGAKALLRVAAVTSVPRLGFQAHAGVLERAFSDPKMPVLRMTGVFWEQCIQNGINSLIRMGADYVITIDYDGIFSNDDVKELLKLAVRYPEADAIAAWQPKRGGKDEALAGLKRGDGTMGGTVSVEEMKRSDLTRVDNTVFGLTIIKVAALKKMEKPWFLNVPNAQGEWEHGKHDADSYFWHKFGEAGNTIYMANNVRIGHLQEVVLWCDPDFNFSKQELFDYYRTGKPF